MTISKKITKILEKCNNKKITKDTSDTCFHYKIETIKQIKNILQHCKKNEQTCIWTSYYFPKSFLLVIQIADNEISLYLENYFQKKYNITPDDLKIEDLHDIYKLNIPLLDSNVKLKDPIFYNLYIKYSEFMENLNNLIVDKTKISSLKISDLENFVNNYIDITNEICSHLTSVDSDLCDDCICNNLENL